MKKKKKEIRRKEEGVILTEEDSTEEEALTPPEQHQQEPAQGNNRASLATRNNFNRQQWWEVLEYLYPQYNKRTPPEGQLGNQNQILLQDIEDPIQQLLDQFMGENETNLEEEINNNNTTLPLDDTEFLEYIHAYQDMETPLQETTTRIVFDGSPDYSFNSSIEPDLLPANIRRIFNRGLKFNLKEKPKFIARNYPGLDLPGEMEIHIKELERNGIIEENKRPLACSPIFGIRKANGKLRIIHDHKEYQCLYT